ncbi:serine acetyltransferase [Oscillatoria amoena NRMC-F 0135]|nr:serine O-acetyltransferase EpsC [Oscillatoria laete-virens]MDL5051054.1 serine acetyltransferase [Oscillatoria amoena NRMC-F 0135]MDL5054501.1 serine acetyltransferase [Oscillatoria laete-virens NRMC-F 0139]
MKTGLDSVVKKLLESYETVGAINHIDGVNLPSKEAVSGITRELLHLVFPGFYNPQEFHTEQCEIYITRALERVAEHLETQTRKSLDYALALEKRADATDVLAGQAVEKFLGALPGIRSLLKHDVAAAYEGDPAAKSFEEIILAYPCIEAIAVQRMAHVLYNLGVPLIPRMMTEWAHSRTGIDIHPGTQIGTHFFIDHGTGVVIGETAIIGNHVKLYQGVTLGAKSFRRDDEGRIVKGGKRHPTIEDDVTIYAGATILGGETVIGEGSVIGGNVWLVESVPAKSIVVMEDLKLNIRPKSGAATVDFQI